MKYSHVWHPSAGCQISFIGYALKLCAYDGVAAVILILGAIVTFKKKEKLILGCSIIAAVIPFIISLVCVELPTPEITRKEDYSAIVLTASKGVKIEYQIRDNGKEEWVKYQKPFKVKQNTIVYA